MRSARIRTAWKNKRRQISIEEHAVAVAAVAWRVSLNAAKNLHDKDFVYNGDVQRLRVMREYLYFLIHFADRFALEKLGERRAAFTTALANECRRHYLENERDIISPPPDDCFIAQLNERLGGYAGARFVDGEPGYGAFRVLGLLVLECMGEDQTNRWVLDQVVEIDGPETVKIFGRALRSLNQAVEKSEQHTG